MGFGAQTGIDYPGESSGLLFDPLNIRDVELFTSSFGQGPSVTPLQQINAMNAIVNGGHLLQPRLIKATMDAAEVKVETEVKEIRTVLSEETMKRMRDILLYVLNAPGSKGASSLYTLAGKTGTANKFNTQTGGYYDDIFIASTIGFAPAENPRYTIYIYLDNPHGPNGYYGGQTAAPTFRKIAEEILKVSGYLPEELPEASITGSSPTILPDYKGKLWQDIKGTFKEEDKVITIGNGTQIAAQYPVAGSEFSQGQTLSLYLIDPALSDSTQIQMPNLIGKTLAESLSVTQQMELILVTSGNGTCVEQSLQAGKLVTKGSSVRAKFN